MNRRISWFTHSVALALYLALALPEPAQAYIGPGAGITAIGTVIALIGAILLAIAGFVWYPIKRLLRKRAQGKDTDRE